MKNLILSIIVLAGLLPGCVKEDVAPVMECGFVGFKYYKDEEDFLGEMSRNYILLGVDTAYDDDQIQEFISSVKDDLDHNYSYTVQATAGYKFKEIPVKLKSSKTCGQIAYIISRLEKNEIISYVHYTVDTDDCNDMIGRPMGNKCIISYGSNFYVRVHDKNDLEDLNRIVSETRTEIVGPNAFMPEVFELRATKYSLGDALKMANYFHETGLFEYAEPGISQYPVE